MTDLELKASIERKSKLLKALIIGWIALHVIALVIMVVPPITSWDQFLVIGVSLALSIGIFYLNHLGFTPLAALLFCVVTNAILGTAFIFNLTGQGAPVTTAILGNLLSLGILFSGMLISSGAILWFTLLNTAIIVIPFLRFGSTIYDGLGESFPIVAFLWLIALVSWFYQKTLTVALVSLTQARQEAAHAKVLQRDVEIAHHLQQQLYPPPPQYGRRICFAARCEPAQETGGDFYDFIKLDEEHLGIVVADVSGKSIPAAMVMAMTRSIIRHGARLSLSPAEVLHQTNLTAIKDVNINQMITVFYGILNTQTLELRYANAGHPYPLLKRNGALSSLEVPGFPIKTYPEASYQNQTIQLQADDQLIWISDGIVEAHNSQKKLFGFEQLEATIRRTSSLGPDDLLNHIWQAVVEHQGETVQTDDITLVVANIGQE